MDVAPSWIETHQLMQEHYLDLSYHEDNLRVVHDAYIMFPEEMRRVIEAALPELGSRFLELAEIASVLCRCPDLANTFRGLGFGMDIGFAIWKKTAHNYTASSSEAFPSAAPAANSFSSAVPRGAETVAPSASTATQNLPGTASSAESITRQDHGIHVIQGSLVDRIDYYGRWMQTVSAIQIAQGYQALNIMTDISNHLADQNTIAVSGSGGPDGFAQHVYDFAKLKVEEINQSERKNHRFFLYHRDTTWYGAFHRLIRQNPLPPTFCAKSNNLDTLCQYMLGVRAELEEKSTNGRDIKFHLLIPSWYHLSIKEPLHFPDELQPFQVEGEEDRGNAMTEFNLPAAPAGLLHGVANVLDPRHWNTIAGGAAAATTLPAVGWGVNGACLAIGVRLGALTGLGAIVAAPTWILAAPPSMARAAPAIGGTVYNGLCEERPRIIGSTQRLSESRS